MSAVDTLKERLIEAFTKADKNGEGTISRRALGMAFRELDDSWAQKELDDMLNAADTAGDGEIKYVEFIEWFLQDVQEAEVKALLEGREEDEGEDPDDADDGMNQDDVEQEDEMTIGHIDLDARYNVDEWVVMAAFLLDIDEDEAKDMYEGIAEREEKEGNSVEGGLPLREYMEELQIELEDKESLQVIEKAIEVANEYRKDKNKKGQNSGLSGAEKKALRTALDKVVRQLDKTGNDADHTWNVLMGDKVPFSKREKEVIEGFKGEKDVLVDKVKKFMLCPPQVNAVAGQQACSERCIAEVTKIIEKCKAEGTHFTDPDWDLKNNPEVALYVDGQKPGYDCTVTRPAAYKRMATIVKKSAGNSAAASALGSLFGGGGGRNKPAPKPILFKGGVRPGDIEQGQIGTCFMLGALGAVISNNEKAIQKLFIKYDVEVGVYGVRFNVDGEWTYVIIDDTMPVDDYGQLLYAHSKDPQEVWCPLLEKAFCKLHTCYEMCDGGQGNEAIGSLFGGCGGKFAIKKKHRKNPGSYFKILKNARDHGWLLTTAFIPRKGVAAAGSGKCGEAMLPSGLVGGHAYSVLKVVEANGIQLVCCRNPWGQGEWTGKWSDRNAYGEWTDEMKKATGYVGANDGKFWMSIKDFVNNSAGADYARTFGPNWGKITHYKQFVKSKMVATASWEYQGGSKDEISFKAGAQIEVQSFAEAWWYGNVVGKEKVGFFPGNYVALNDRPVCRFDLVGTPNKDIKGPMTVVVMLMQPNACMERKFYRRKQDGLNYKDTSYPALQLVIVGPDGKVAMKKMGKKRCVWGELKLPGGGEWRIYALSVDGTGGAFSLRAYVKDGTATVVEKTGASIDEVSKALAG
eukprot:gnl/TRDRNA2_/TRDRNA2_38556_c0_seq1.p1 gnl/TRDRNA2_/TRDRNA2_38556_c0~~gnl/TRDRNA2_/TRDRNA2_38556_c0_seq1.p1  ORF type:complete len:878 (+),score=231.21 gnl/TRDRNA2_/TRDRNA2_38556_c0_seq1:65-2635(+)